MFPGDHIVLNATLAAIASRRLGLAYVPLCFALILVNLIDIDHVFYCNLDDGTANSLLLHPLHIYAGAIISLFSLLALIDVKRVLFWFCLGGGLAAHLAADALAYLWSYSWPVLIAYAIVRFIASFFILRACITRGSYKALFVFLVAQYLVINLSTCWASLSCNIQEHLFPWILPQVLTVVIAGAFLLLFKNKIEMRVSD